MVDACKVLAAAVVDGTGDEEGGGGPKVRCGSVVSVCGCVCVIVAVVAGWTCVFVSVSVMVSVTWMNEVSKIEVVVSIVLVTTTVTSSVTKSVISLVAVTVTVSGPLFGSGLRGASVGAGKMCL